MTDTYDRTLGGLCQRSHEIAVEKGWVALRCPFHTLALLMHSEISEALEDYRDHRELGSIYYEYRHEGVVLGLKDAEVEKARAEHPDRIKPCGIPIELADFVIRVCQYVGTEAAGTNSALLDEFLTNAAACRKDLTIKTFGKEEEGDPLDFECFLSMLHVVVALATKARWEGSPCVLDHLAKAVMGAFFICEEKGIDLWAAIQEKEAFNRTRPKLHGGKKI